MLEMEKQGFIKGGSRCAQFSVHPGKRALEVLDAGPLHGIPVGLHVLGQELFLLCL